MEEIFQISQTISRIIIFEIRILTCNMVLLLRKTFESSERSLVYKLNIEKFIPGYIYVLFSNNKKSNYHCTRRIIIFERNILTHLSLYLIFIRIPGTKSLANEATFRGRGVYTNKMYRDSEPKPYREFILKRNGGRRRRRIRGDDSLNLERGIDLYVGPQSSRDRMEDSTFDAHLIKPEFPIDFLPQCRVTSFEALLRNTVSHGTRSLPILAALKT